MKDIRLRFAARCEAAGRNQNEDNYLLDDDLSNPEWGFQSDKEINLSDKGSLLVVCDGMGGMNAGEVASSIAVDVIKDNFQTSRLTDQVLKNENSICQYIRSVIQKADEAVKTVSNADETKAGMGSTVVMAWILGEKIYVGWCGDSRAYRYNPQTGLERLSHDHSFVQELVDKGELTEELAFDHPNNNIITRSLGDPRGLVQPDVKVFDIHQDDIILLCSDGLCGCLRDREIFSIIENNTHSMLALRDALWKADEAAGWHDNVTTVLAQITAGPILVKNDEKQSISKTAELRQKNANLKIVIGLLFGLLLGLFVGIAMFMLFRPHPEPQPANTETTDSIPSDTLRADSTATTISTTPKPATTEPAARRKAPKKEPEQTVVPNIQKEQAAQTEDTIKNIKGKGELTKIIKGDSTQELTPIKPAKEEPAGPLEKEPVSSTNEEADTTQTNLTPIKK